MFSFGVLMWELLTGRRPWEGYDMLSVACGVRLHGWRLPLYSMDDERTSSLPGGGGTAAPDAHWASMGLGGGWPMPAGRCPPRLRRLLEACWDADPRRRPAAAEAAKELLLAQQVGVAVREVSSCGLPAKACLVQPSTLVHNATSVLLYMCASRPQELRFSLDPPDGSSHAGRLPSSATSGCPRHPPLHLGPLHQHAGCHRHHHHQQHPTPADPQDDRPVSRSDLPPVDTDRGHVAALPVLTQCDAAWSPRVDHGACSGEPRTALGPWQPTAVVAERHADQLLTCVTLLDEQAASRAGEGGRAERVSSTGLDHGCACASGGRSNSSRSSCCCRPSSWHRPSYDGAIGRYGSGSRTSASSLPGINYRAWSAPEGWGCESKQKAPAKVTSRPATSVASSGQSSGMTRAQPQPWQHRNSSASAPAVPVLRPCSRPKLYGPPARRLPYAAAAGSAGASAHRVLSLGPVLENVPYCNDLNDRLPYKPLDPPLPCPCPVLRENRAEPWPQQLLPISIDMDI